MADISEQAVECPVNATIAIIAGKWKPTILCELRDGPKRFSDLKRVIPAISEKVLAAHLRALEADGIISRREFRDGAVLATEYAFTDYGATLKPALNALADWGLRHRKLARE
jgi:DNA-binding HxlR family transcriptional regulator